ncbi:MAG: hypothetical protein ACE5I5_02705 [Candidatus Heimdallarchaeota archaeon]
MWVSIGLPSILFPLVIKEREVECAVILELPFWIAIPTDRVAVPRAKERIGGFGVHVGSADDEDHRCPTSMCRDRRGPALG